jgi:hypothetical protein
VRSGSKNPAIEARSPVRLHISSRYKGAEAHPLEGDAVIMTTKKEVDDRPQAQWAEAKELQRPLPEAKLTVLPAAGDPQAALI